jgi:hypothetical protein
MLIIPCHYILNAPGAVIDLLTRVLSRLVNDVCIVLQIRGFNAMVVPEASARHEYDDHFLAVDADHFGVCKPISKVDSSFLWLTNFVFGLQTSEFRITNGQERRQEAAVLL